MPSMQKLQLLVAHVGAHAGGFKALSVLGERLADRLTCGRPRAGQIEPAVQVNFDVREDLCTIRNPDSRISPCNSSAAKART